MKYLLSLLVVFTLAAPLSASRLVERFETGPSCSNCSEPLASGSWFFTNSYVTDDMSGDDIVINGRYSAQLEPGGNVAMEFNVPNAKRITFRYQSSYTTTNSAAFALESSTNNGMSWSTVQTFLAEDPEQIASVVFSSAIPVRFRIRSTSSAGERFAIDDFHIDPKVLFDATKHETSGNADWCIDADNDTSTSGLDSAPQQFPTPDQSMVTLGTTENYWRGALSNFAIDLVKQGVTVETLPAGATISFGVKANAQDLSKYDAFIVDEPNVLFTAAEKTAILQFVSKGGGLFMASDHSCANGAGNDPCDANHTKSDRDNNGSDSVDVWNDLMTNNAVQVNPFGFKINWTQLHLDQSTNSFWAFDSYNPILHGPIGNAQYLQYNDGAMATITNTSQAQGLFWKSGGAQGTTQIMALQSRFGSGHVFFVGDSSPIEDGSGDTWETANGKLFQSWQLNFSGFTTPHRTLFLNATLWLAN